METKRDETIKTDNELIAEFMGDRDKILCDPKWMKGDELVYLRYHLSWDWLMPVVAKITPIATQMGQQAWHDVKYHLIDADIKLVYQDTVRFIKWFNQQPK